MLVVSSEAGTSIDFSKGTEIGGGGETPDAPAEITVADFLKAPVDDNVYYILTGEITDLYDTEYGNFTLVVLLLRKSIKMTSRSQPLALKKAIL